MQSILLFYGSHKSCQSICLEEIGTGFSLVRPIQIHLLEKI